MGGGVGRREIVVRCLPSLKSREIIFRKFVLGLCHRKLLDISDSFFHLKKYNSKILAYAKSS